MDDPPSRSALRSGLRYRARRLRRVGARVHAASFRRTRPVDRAFGRGGGLPIDRYYGEAFMARNAAVIRGAVLEVGDDRYTRALGGGRVTRSDVLHAEPGNPLATMVGDLATGAGLPEEPTYDCVILYDTLQCIFDVRAAVDCARRLLLPGGAVLATFDGIAQISRDDYARWGEYWRPTELAVRRLFGDCFGEEQIEVEAHGNVLAAAALLYGISAEEIGTGRLDHSDPDYQVCIAVKATQGRVERQPTS